MQRVCVICEDEFLFRRIRSELSPIYECVRYDKSDSLPSDITVAEGSSTLSDDISADLILSYPETLPLCVGDIAKLIAALPKKPRLIMMKDEYACTLDGERIALTELEYRLLDLLVSKNGDYFQKSELCEKVFGKGGVGMLNLYVHYLRAKLEGDSKRIIISQRNLGYRISEEFIKGDSVC